MEDIKIIKRDGRIVDFDIGQIRKQTIPACQGLYNVHPEVLEESLKVVIDNNVTTEHIQKSLITAALNNIDIDKPDYTYVAARLTLYDLYHKIKSIYGAKKSGDVYSLVSLLDYITINTKNGLLDTRIREKYTDEEIMEIDNIIESEKDLEFTLPSVRLFIDRYGLKNNNGELVELPQHMFATIALFLCQDEDSSIRLDLAKIVYKRLSNLEIILATPHLANARKKIGSSISCLITTVPDDLIGIFDVLKEVGLGSKLGSGWGIDFSRVRSVGGTIANKKGVAGGKIPFLKIFDSTSLAVDQLMTRPGAFAVYIEIWDIEIFDFIKLSKKNGDSRRSCPDLFKAISVNDLFMEREASDEYYTLFDPKDAPMLTELYGKEFRAEYIRLEKEFMENPDKFNPNTTRVKARDIMREWVITYYEEGMPWAFFKDTANERHRNKNLGIIRSSNLCMEILQPTDDQHTAVCNLCSINLARVKSDKHLEGLSRLATRILDNSIDLTDYPSKKSKLAQIERRSLGIGSLGEAEYIANKKIHYGSDEHIKVTKHITKIMRDAIESESKSLAEEKGSCIVDGYRNAYFMAIAPNSNSAVFAGTTKGIEPVFDKVWLEETLLGTFKNTAPGLNPDNYNYYDTAYNIDQYKIIDVVASKYEAGVDMGISMNLFLNPENLKASEIRNLIRYAWEKKVPTIYYINSKPPKETNSGVSKSDNKINCFNCSN